MTPGKLYRLKPDFSEDSINFTFNKFDTIQITKNDLILLLNESFGYSGANYYFLFDNKIIHRFYAYEVLEEVLCPQ